MEAHSPGYQKLTDWSTLKNNHYYQFQRFFPPLSPFLLYSAPLLLPPLLIEQRIYIGNPSEQQLSIRLLLALMNCNVHETLALNHRSRHEDNPETSQHF